MAEHVQNKQVFSLFEVSKSIQKTIAERYQNTYWIKAEMNKLNYYSHSGHCYPELVEKQDGRVIAQMKASLWKDDYLNANRNFLRVLKEPLKDGIKILFLAKILFDPAYGLSLRIIDIDPAYTLGDLEREKQDTLAALREENIFTKNKMLTLPLLPKRLAIISVETSKGYADFIKVLDTNIWKYSFFHFLFPSLLQGEKAPPAIIAQLRKIENLQHHFDAVAIIRGGGGDVGLSCYNDYALAKEIALFPLPVITGIGHATNETVTEMVSFANAITPTKLAEFLLQLFHDFSTPVQKAQEKIVDRSRRLLADEKIKFAAAARMLRSVTENILIRQRNGIREKQLALQQQSKLMIGTNSEIILRRQENVGASSRTLLKECSANVAHIEKNVSNMDPRNVLRRGFSISYAGGRIIKAVDDAACGEEIRTVVYDGEIISNVSAVTKNK